MIIKKSTGNISHVLKEDNKSIEEDLLKRALELAEQEKNKDKKSTK